MRKLTLILFLALFPLIAAAKEKPKYYRLKITTVSGDHLVCILGDVNDSSLQAFGIKKKFFSDVSDSAALNRRISYKEIRTIKVKKLNSPAPVVFGVLGGVVGYVVTKPSNDCDPNDPLCGAGEAIDEGGEQILGMCIGALVGLGIGELMVMRKEFVIDASLEKFSEFKRKMGTLIGE